MDDEEWVLCSTCDGEEGYWQDDEWVLCPDCEGEGGHLERVVEQKEV